MKASIDNIKNNKRIIDKEELKKYVNNHNNGSDVVDGIYSKEGGLASFMKWIKNAYLNEKQKNQISNMKM